MREATEAVETRALGWTWVASMAVLAMAGLGGAAPASAQTNFLTLNNGSERGFTFPGSQNSGMNPNLYYRCYPAEILWAPHGGGTFPGLDGLGWQLAGSVTSPLLPIDFPILFFAEDPTGSCLLSAAMPSAFPPNAQTIASSPKTILAVSFGTPVPSTFPVAWWFHFASASFPMPDPEDHRANLLAGWSDPVQTSSASFQYVIGSDDEGAARSRSFAVLNATGGGATFQAQGAHEWELIVGTGEAAINPEFAASPGAFDAGGSSGYEPRILPGAEIRFRVFDGAQGGQGAFPLVVANLIQGPSPTRHVPGIQLLGQHLALNLDPLVLVLLALPFVGGAYTAVGGAPAPNTTGPTWNPSMGWTPGGESLTPSIAVSFPSLVGEWMAFGAYTLDLAAGPIVRGASNSGELQFR